MRRLFHIFCMVLLVTGCVTELPGVMPRGEETDELVLRFGASDVTDVQVNTKGSLGLEPESRVFNLYVFIFNSAGNKVYSKYFNKDNLLKTTLPDWWEVSNNEVQSDGTTKITSGTIHLKTLKKTNLATCTIAVITNIDAEMVNISPEQLSTIGSLNDLLELKANMNQVIVSRSGYFPMSGILYDVDIDDLATEKEAGYVGSTPILILKRLDAKIQFNVQVEPGCPIRSFQPLKWQVFNVPKMEFVLEHGEYSGSGTIQDASGDSEDDYFNTFAANFETQELYKTSGGTTVPYSGTTDPIIKHGFSFYMMENRKVPAAELGPVTWTFSKRDTVDHANGGFYYAPARSTYVVLSCEVGMDETALSTTKKATLSGNVEYIIHLGNFGSSLDNFKVFRNHTYTYNIYIRNLEDVRAEVEINYDAAGDETHVLKEFEPGASGNVVVAKDSIIICDAHYSSHVLTFHAEYIDDDNITWNVLTPFNPEGASPYTLPDGTELLSEIDCKWVEFRVNEKNSDGLYDNKRQLYHPNKTMDITELVKFLRLQKGLYNEDKAAGRNPESDNWANLFDKEKYPVTGAWNPKICVTAFVNEYYYETDPITKAYVPDLWKRFVNQPMRQLHILSKVKSSADGESSEIGSSLTILQQSIQTIYNVNNSDLHSAWGMEHTDDALETGDAANQKYFDSNLSPNDGNSYRGNSSTTNGRLNSAKEWYIVDQNGNDINVGTRFRRWDNYLNLTGDNTTPYLRFDVTGTGENHRYRYLRWSCLSRNRDNNGDGVIDNDEIRWYMAASNQLIGIFLGEYGIDRDAHLYQRSLVEQGADATSGRNIWRQHVVASTCNATSASNTKARVIWAEEGLTGSDIGYYSASDGSTDVYNTRCVRNLGHDPNSPNSVVKDFSYSPFDHEPANVIDTKRLRTNPKTGVDEEWPDSKTWDENVYYVFDCSRINEASLRYYTNRELVAHDETHEASCLYKKFTVSSKKLSQTKPVPSTLDGMKVQYPRDMNHYLDLHINDNPFCPEGYRLPNVREDAVIWSFIPTSDRSSFLASMYNHSRTHWSFGIDGKNNKHLSNLSWGWTISSGKIIMGNDRTYRQNQPTSYIRCVKDIKVN